MCARQGALTDDLKPWLQAYWPEVKERLLEGSYRPESVRGVEIPKPNGGKRQLGKPMVVDIDLAKFLDTVGLVSR